MPELPEVETMVRGIRPHIQGRTVAAVRRCRCRCKPISVSPAFPTLARRIRGTQIADVRRLAKRVVLTFSTGDSLAVEPRMTGLMLLADPPDREHLRLQFNFNDAGSNASADDLAGRYRSLWFWDRRGLGTVRLYRPGELETELGPHRIGPDALEATLDDWRRRCGKTSRPVKVALLDQKWIAGIGNLYASEILHKAKIHPAAVCSELSDPQVSRLFRSTRKILNDAIRDEGSTLNDFTYRNALNQNGRYQNRHRVYRREKTVCRTCRGGTIVRFVQSQRSTFFCPICQPESPRVD